MSLIGVHQAYYGVLLAQSFVRLAQQTVKARQTVVDQISELIRNKLKSELDLSFAQVNLSDADLMQIRAQNELEGSYAALNQALGSQRSELYRLTPEEVLPPPPQGPEPLVEEALSHRPEVASLRLRNESDQKLQQAEADLKRPTVTLTAVAGFLPFIKPGMANPDIPAEYEGAAVNVQIPVFNGHLFSARERALPGARIQPTAARHRRFWPLPQVRRSLALPSVKCWPTITCGKCNSAGWTIHTTCLARGSAKFCSLSQKVSLRKTLPPCSISIYTVDTHRSNLLGKLNVHGLPELILYAVRKGVIS